jgi:hypothetical protein
MAQTANDRQIVTVIAYALGQVFQRHSIGQNGCTPFSKDRILQEHRATERRSHNPEACI